jgi:hypothetical protein
VSLGVYRPDCTITSNTPAEEAILTDFSDILEKGGSTVTIVPEIQRVKFVKNLQWNLSLSAIATLVGYRLPAIFRAPPKSGEEYEPYVSDTTKRHVEEYTIPNIRAIFEEALVLGMCSLIFLRILCISLDQHVRWAFPTHLMASHLLLSIPHSNTQHHCTSFRRASTDLACS